LLLANGVAGLFMTAFSIVLLWRAIQGFEWKPLVSSLARIALASLAMVGVLYWIHSLGYTPAATLASRASYLAALLAVAAAVYFGAARALGIEELTIVMRTLKQKLARATAATP
jgi:hypothetical protein